MHVPSSSAPRLLRYSMTHDALDLLDAAGVKTFTELAQWDAPGLQHHLAQVNATVRRVGDAPPVAAVASWIAHARRSARVADRHAQSASPLPARLPGLRRLYAYLSPR